MIIGFLDIFQLNSIHALFHFINFEYLSGFSRSHVFQLINYGDLYGFFFFFFVITNIVYLYFTLCEEKVL